MKFSFRGLDSWNDWFMTWQRSNRQLCLIKVSVASIGNLQHLYRGPRPLSLVAHELIPDHLPRYITPYPAPGRQIGDSARVVHEVRPEPDVR